MLQSLQLLFWGVQCKAPILMLSNQHMVSYQEHVLKHWAVSGHNFLITATLVCSQAKYLDVMPYCCEATSMHQHLTCRKLCEQIAIQVYLAGHLAGAAQIQFTRKLFQATPAVNIKAAPVANQSAAASTAVILVMNLYGTNLVPFGLAQRAVLITALGNTTLTAASMELLSVSEFLPNNTTPSPAPSRRHLLTVRKLGEPAVHLCRLAD